MNMAFPLFSIWASWTYHFPSYQLFVNDPHQSRSVCFPFWQLDPCQTVLGVSGWVHPRDDVTLTFHNVSNCKLSNCHPAHHGQTIMLPFIVKGINLASIRDDGSVSSPVGRSASHSASAKHFSDFILSCWSMHEWKVCLSLQGKQRIMVPVMLTSFICFQDWKVFS